jgi:germination protein M
VFTAKIHSFVTYIFYDCKTYDVQYTDRGDTVYKLENKKLLIFGIFVTILFVIVSCSKITTGNKETQDDQKTTITLYFVDPTQTQLKAEQREISGNSQEELLQSVLEELKQGPETPGLLPSIPQQVQFEMVVLENEMVNVGISFAYDELTPQEQVLMRASLVKTLTEFSFIEQVQLLIDGAPLLGTDGIPIGPMEKEDIVLDVLIPATPTNKQVVKLYFSDKEAQKLMAEEREIEVNPNDPLEKYIVVQLITGPTNPDLVKTVPAETTIKDIETNDGVCYVDLSNAFRTKHWGGSTGETFTIYSIVNSLTELPNVKKVQFLIEGEKQEDFKGHYDFSAPFERDENLIQ